MARQALRQLSTSLRALGTVFENRDLRRLELAWACFSFAIWSYAIALGVYAFDAGGPAAVGIAGLVRLLPGALASPFAGMLGDRHSRRAVLLASAIASALALLGSAISVAAGAPVALVFGLAGLFTISASPYIPAQGALLPAISRTPQELSAANVAYSAMENGGFLLGAVLTGILLAASGPELAFTVAALAAVIAAALNAGLTRDRRPESSGGEEVSGVLAETGAGFRTLLDDPKVRLVGAMLTLLVFFEGAADVLAVIVVLDLLELSEGAVGYLNAAWGIGALAGGAALAVMLSRGNLALGLVAGSLTAGAALSLPGVWPVAIAAYLGWGVIGVGYTLVDVAARTLLQRLGSGEILARVTGSLETSRLAAMAMGSIAASGLVALLGSRAALMAFGALLPLFTLLRWRALRAFEIGAPVTEGHFALLRGDPIFAPLPVATLERLSRDCVPLEATSGIEVITEGDHGDRFYLIEAGEVEVLQSGSWLRNQGPGESFGEIALLRDSPRTATVRATCATRLLAVEREHFIAAVTGHATSRQTATAVAEARLVEPPESR